MLESALSLQCRQDGCRKLADSNNDRVAPPYEAEQGSGALSQEHGTALVSGFSGQLLKLFLANDLENMTPESIMLEAIKGGKYDSWTVVD